MTTATAHEIGQSFDCSVNGCTDTAKSNRGIYAYLCDRHTQEKRHATPQPAGPKAAGGGLHRRPGTAAAACAGRRQGAC